MTIHHLVPDCLPQSDVAACCAALHANAKQGKLTGIAFVAKLKAKGSSPIPQAVLTTIRT